MDGYKHTRVEGIVDTASENWRVFQSLSKGFEGIPVFNLIFELLDDRNPKGKTINDKNVVGMVNFVGKFYVSAGWFIMQEKNLKKLITKGHRPLYKVLASGRLRVATIQEVENGVRGLKAEFQSPLSEIKVKQLYLLLWAATGNDYFYYESGHKFDREPAEMRIYSQIANASRNLALLMEWMSDEQAFITEMNVIRSFGNKPYKYPEYETDEMTEELTRKQLVYSLRTSIPGGSENDKHKKILGIILKEQSNKWYTIPPEKISEMRDVYAEILENGAEKPKVNEKLKAECDRLEEARDKGILKPEEFVFKIVGSMKKLNYSNCSEKQYKVIDEALNKLGKVGVVKDVSEEEDWPDEPSDLDKLVEELNYMDNSVLDVSDALGGGDLS